MNHYHHFDTAVAAGIALSFIFIFLAIIALVSITIWVLFLLNLQHLLTEIDSKNREVESTNVWLMLIPLFNLVYGFILLPKVCDAIKKEYAYRRMEETGNFGRDLALAIPILTLCSIIPILGGLAAIANLVLFIIFWVKMAEYKNKLRNAPKVVETTIA